METELYKTRSLSSCMKAAYDMYRTNIKTIFRRTWIPALVFAALTAIAIVIYYNTAYQSPDPLVMPSKTTIVSYIAGSIFALLAVAASVWFDAILISLLNGASMKANLPRVIRLTVLIAVLAIVVTIVAALLGMIPFAGVKPTQITENMMTASGAISVAVYVVFVIALLPTIYSSMKFLMEPEQKVFSVLGKSYRTGWRHWGYIFMICLIAGIILGIIYFVVSLPLNITSIAVTEDAAGMALGDPSGLPGYFKFITFLAGIISSFITIYIGAWFTIIGYYAYGHIEAKEKEKKERKTTLAKAEATEEKMQSTTKEPDFEEIK